MPHVTVPERLQLGLDGKNQDLNLAPAVSRPQPHRERLGQDIRCNKKTGKSAQFYRSTEKRNSGGVEEFALRVSGKTICRVTQSLNRNEKSKWKLNKVLVLKLIKLQNA